MIFKMHSKIDICCTYIQVWAIASRSEMSLGINDYIKIAAQVCEVTRLPFGTEELQTREARRESRFAACMQQINRNCASMRSAELDSQDRVAGRTSSQL